MEERTKRIISVRDLDVYKLAFETAMEIFEISKKFPKEERYSLTDQIRKSSRSVCANLAEGWRKRRYKAVFINKLSDAAQEAAETQTWLEFALRSNYIDRDTFDKLDEKYEHIFAMLNTMEQKADTFCKARPSSFILSSFILSSFILLSSVLQADAGIVLKLIATNPSKEQTQKVSVKAYLPKETKSEDIIDKGDLEIAYDTQQGSYYIYGEYELKPGEVLEREIEMRDIWVIPDPEIKSLRLESIKLADLLKNTEFAERLSFLENNIESKLNQIIESQKSSPANPERHISDYRENLRILESAKADLALARSLLSQARPVPTAVVWRLIIAIIIFLGLLGLSFYFIWRKEFKTITQEASSSAPQKEEGSIASESKPTRHQAREEEKLKPQDIEKILEEKSKEEGET